ncbi:MAG: TraR/DksA C4-type zinc finger protein [candidate division KSB1 bacterium]|nr:TraR/DksA C4-type zinc finger protein [candidate division KSB1 bacterium]
MKKEDLEYFKTLLLEKRQELLDEMEQFKNRGLSSTIRDASGEHSTYTYHMADQGTDTDEQEKAFFFASINGNLLYHLDRALERIADGTYGLCVGCGKPISRERLEAVPHARLCIACKLKEETTR